MTRDSKAVHTSTPSMFNPKLRLGFGQIQSRASTPPNPSTPLCTPNPSTPLCTRTPAPPSAPQTPAPPSAPRTPAPPSAPRTPAPPSAPRTPAPPSAPPTPAPPSAPRTPAPPSASGSHPLVSGLQRACTPDSVCEHCSKAPCSLYQLIPHGIWSATHLTCTTIIITTHHA